jgi:hypothetical protein
VGVPACPKIFRFLGMWFENIYDYYQCLAWRY